jgi:hypothetical protein
MRPEDYESWENKDGRPSTLAIKE